MTAAYAEVLAWTLIAIGAAVALGTGAAIWQFHRTGNAPGRGQTDAAVNARGAVAKCLVGGLLVVGGVASLLAVRAG